MIGQDSGRIIMLTVKGRKVEPSGRRGELPSTNTSRISLDQDSFTLPMKEKQLIHTHPHT